MRPHRNTLPARLVQRSKRQIDYRTRRQLVTDMHIDDGYYESPNVLVRALNGEKGGRVKLSYDRVTQEVCVQMKGDTTFKLYGDLIDILGFRERHDQNGDPLDTPGKAEVCDHQKTLLRCRFRPKPSSI